MCDILGYISIWNLYIKSKLCGVSNQWEEISGDILGITDCYWSEVYVYTTEDYSANTIYVYVHKVSVSWPTRVYLLCGCFIGLF